MKRTMSIAKAKARFAECVRRAERGETIILTRHGRPAARLAPVGSRIEGSSGEIREPQHPYGGARLDPGARPALRSRREELAGLLEEIIWPRVPKDQIGAGPGKREREEILGYDERDGV